MSNEPSKRIERMLRKWARNRRDAAGAGWPVHPATRRLLQGEVARTLGAHGAARAGTGHGWLALFWPRLVWGGAGLALIALVWVWLPRSAEKPMELAAVNQNAPVAVDAVADRKLNFAAEPASPPPGFSPAPAPAPKPQAATASDERAKRLVSQQEVLLDAKLAAAGKELKKGSGGDEAALPERAAGGAGAAGAGPQPLLELAKQSEANPAEAKFAAEKSESLTRRNDALARAPVTTKAKEFADRGVDQRKDMAKLSDAALGVAPISAPAAAPQPTVPQPTASAARGESSGGAAGRFTVLAPAGPVAMTATAPANARSLALAKTPQPGVAASSLVREEALAAATAPTAPAAPGGGGEGIAPQNFVRLNAPDSYRRNLQSPPSPALLQQFQIQRAGNAVTVVDEDGSVYQGQVIAAETRGNRANRRLPEMQRKSDLATTADKAADKAGEKNAGQPMSQAATRGTDPDSFWFRASGTNRSLNQRVVFTGEFQSRAGDADAPTADELAKRAALRSEVSATNNQQYGFQRAAGAAGATATGRIQGRAQVGANSEIQVEAVSSGSPRR